MYLDLRTQSAASAAAATMAVGPDALTVWPREQPLQPIADARVLGTRFQDAARLHPAPHAAILAQAARQPANMHGWGGKKVRDAQTWSLPELQLLTRRALLFAARTQNWAEAHLTDRWANVMEHGEYSTPHCHYDAEIAVVYAFDAGDEFAACPTSGALEIIDPRIEFCCSKRPGYPSRGILPQMLAGTMLLFPASYLHYVKPYLGTRPRITLAWNISPGPPPRDASGFDAQVEGTLGRW